jgi:hypothetical protein
MLRPRSAGFVPNQQSWAVRAFDIKDVPLNKFDARLTLRERSLASIVGMSEEPSRP